MHTAPLTRKISLSALAALMLLLGALVIAATAAPQASANIFDCSAGQICVWEDTSYTGQMSWWWQGDRGCKTHRENPNIRSAYNLTRYTVQLGGREYVNPTYPWSSGNPAIYVTGVICW